MRTLLVIQIVGSLTMCWAVAYTPSVPTIRVRIPQKPIVSFVNSLKRTKIKQKEAGVSPLLKLCGCALVQ